VAWGGSTGGGPTSLLPAASSLQTILGTKGCAVGVGADFEDEVYDKADALIGRYEAPGRSCAYDCDEAPDPECLERACELIWE